MTEHERGMLLSSMSDDSVARTLGRSLAWVKRCRAAVAEAVPPKAVEAVQARVAVKRERWTRAAMSAPVSPKREASLPGKPVSPDILRWARWFLDAQWPLTTVADLFDVSAASLIKGLNA
ncbi:MAG: hypothetical protein JHC81_04790 [Brevundimonas sp.]|uniref:hypothetical protein n=1 Tax=Brevundimonas sp. TaxID=1871086 RepID=UPI001A350D29|nr:hypothetical protein [Brevundimonas sp.]MBJ7446831.1 hypothetical protein [Brevundimonas sp.]